MPIDLQNRTYYSQYLLEPKSYRTMESWEMESILRTMRYAIESEMAGSELPLERDDDVKLRVAFTMFDEFDFPEGTMVLRMTYRPQES